MTDKRKRIGNVLLVFGFLLMVTTMVTESEPGALPLGIILLGALTRFLPLPKTA